MEWKISPEPVPYEEAVALMEARVRQIQADEADELVWLLEHPALYTAGASAKYSDLVDAQGFPVVVTGRGGQYTYHGPGQRIAYVMLNLKKRTMDVRLFVKQLEQWVIAALDGLGVKGEIRDGRVGVWVEVGEEQEARSADRSGNDSTKTEAKIAALGVRIQKWVTSHGVSINVNPDLSHYRGIVPCGISEYGVTSLAELGMDATMKDLDRQLVQTFREIF